MSNKKIHELYKEQEEILKKFSLLEAAKIFTKELNELKKDGFAYTYKDVEAHRIKICSKCLEQKVKKFTRCPKCSCIISQKVKFKLSHCPIRKWGEVKSTANEYIKDNKI